MDRIIESSHFKRANTQARMLKVIVEKALEGQSLNEIELGLVLFPHFDPESHIVRATASIIRKKLTAYYLEEGRDDLVRIELPQGPPYVCSFSYNSRAYVLEAFEHASKMLGHYSYRSVSAAREMLSGVIQGIDNPMPDEHRFAPVYTLHAECTILLDISRQIFWNVDNNRGSRIYRRVVSNNTYVDDVMERLEEAREIDATLVQTDLVVGGFLLLVGQTEMAAESFRLAETKDPAALRRSLWYPLFLWLVKGDTQSAYAITEEIIRLSPDRDGPRYLAAFIAYSAKDFRKAAGIVNTIYDHGEYYPLALEGLIALAMNEFEIASRKFRVLGGENYGGIIEGEDPNEHRYFVGFLIMSLCGEGKIEEAEKQFTLLKARQNVSALDMCVASLAFGDVKESLRWLAEAINSGNIFAIWATKLPLFDSLAAKMTEQFLSDFVRQRLAVR